MSGGRRRSSIRSGACVSCPPPFPVRPAGTDHPGSVRDGLGGAADLEQELPTYQPHVQAFRVKRGEGDRLEGLASGYGGLRARFDVVLRPGWRWMQSRFLLFGLAAVPVPGGTLLARAGGSRVPGTALLQPLRARGLARELDRLERRVLHRRRQQ
jgi:hypothetical protein